MGPRRTTNGSRVQASITCAAFQSTTSTKNCQTMTLKEKELRVVEFVNEFLTSLVSSSISGPYRLTLIAKSPASPVARGVEHCLKPIVAAGVELQVIFAERGAEGRMAPWLENAASVAWAKDCRLLEMHEQLVLGRAMCWLGDAMRRDVEKSDLHETFARDCVRTAAIAQGSFERIGRLCVPLPVQRITGSLRGRPTVLAAGAPQGAGAPDAVNKPSPTTRH